MLQVLDGVAVHAGHDPGCFRASPDDAGVHCAFHDRDALARPAEHFAGAGPHPVEVDLARAAAVHRGVSAHVKAGSVRVDGEHGEPFAVPRFSRGPGAHRDDIRRGGVEHDALGPGQPVAVAVRLGAGLDVGELVA